MSTISAPIGDLDASTWRYVPWVVLALVGSVFAYHFYEMLGHWRVRHGYEPEWVAMAIAQGHGFSFPGDRHWLFNDTSPDDYYPTAWVDPVFTYLYAGCLSLFGEYGRLALASVNLVVLAATMVVVFHLGKQLAGRAGGIISITLIVLHWRFHSPPPYYDNSMLGALLVSTSTLMLLRCLDQFTLRALVGLGVILGITILGCPSTMLFLPAVAFALLTSKAISVPRRAFGALIAATVAVAVVSPWTLRNYLTFGEFVPVRTGLGQITYVGTVALAATFEPGSAKSMVAAPWTASGPLQAVKQVRQKEARRALEDYQMDVMAANPPSGWTTMNEAQRDALYRSRASEYVLEHPITTAELAFFKLYLFGRSIGNFGVVLLGLALVSAALAASDQRVRALLFLVVAYALPYAIIICYWDRYRRPIEPLIVVLVAIGLALMTRHLGRRLPNLSRESSHQPRS